MTTLQRAAALPPRMRGVLHTAAVPLCLAAGVVLVSLAPTAASRASATIYAATALALFAVSALYHLGRGTPARHRLLKRLDHGNIYLIIAGTYTPFAVLALSGPLRATILWAVWGGAAAGVAMHLFWVRPPVWLTTPLYVGLGWIPAFAIPDLLTGAGVAAVVLAIVGGGLYTAGGLVYAARWPDPAPSVFGYHEVFHTLTIAAFATQYVAVSMVVYGAG
ncbi:MAG TPA: hemolysin III family protein [Miltoncostaeaceae bacterium]|nr:hemolysin III family protein [Miltoncostaeaceae bacterium]